VELFAKPIAMPNQHDVTGLVSPKANVLYQDGFREELSPSYELASQGED
jgi:hypothetical protein